MLPFALKLVQGIEIEIGNWAWEPNDYHLCPKNVPWNKMLHISTVGEASFLQVILANT